MKKIVLVLSLLVSVSIVLAQSPIDRPKLVVGITVDQMRQEYIYRYYSKFGENGFKRLIREGFMLANAHYNYIPTVTGAGHASIFTGTTPANHGIVGNDWYDKELRQRVYCVEDSTQTTVGSASVNEGQMSPHRMLSTTITDEMRLFSQMRSKTIGISIKDRGAILPAGHTANAAYWYDSKTGKFITSSFYMKTLPAWVERFNAMQLPDKYLNTTWTTALPIEQYTESSADVSPYESKLKGQDKRAFPYDLKTLRKQNDNYDLLSYTPFSDDLLTEFAKAVIAGEKLGDDSWTDFLCISYSAPDKLGHDVGPNAVELEDLYIRLDKNIEDLLNSLDKTAGKGNYLVFLTADHAVAEVPQYLRDQKVPAGNLLINNIRVRLEEFLQNYFPGKAIIADMINDQVYLNHQAFSNDPRAGGVEMLIATELIMNFLLQEKGIASVYSKNILRQGNYSEGGHKGMIIRGYNTKRSGDIVMVYEPGWFDWSKVQGATHGSSYTYDTHVPIIFFGKGIKQGTTVKQYAITDIAPTLAMLLKIRLPNASTGVPVEEAIDK